MNKIIYLETLEFKVVGEDKIIHIVDSYQFFNDSEIAEIYFENSDKCVKWYFMKESMIEALNRRGYVVNGN